MRTHRPHPDVTVLQDAMEVPGLGHLPINAYVLHAAEPVVIDTGLGLPDRDFVRTLAEVIDPAQVRWIWLTHPDRDHTGGLEALLDAAPEARLVTTFTGAGILSTSGPVPLHRVYFLNPGESLDVGDRTLTGFRPPLFDNAATVGLFDHQSGLCFSSDCFGAPLASADQAAADVIDGKRDDIRAAQLLWATVDSPWVHRVDPAKFVASFAPLRDFDPSWVLCTHLPPVEGDVSTLLDTIATVPDLPEFVGPDQVALEAMLAQFEPVPAP